MAIEEELFGQLVDDVQLCKEYLWQVSNAMRKGEVSKYPIFVAHREDIDIGVPIIHKAEMDLSWSYSASHLEDFVNKKMILPDKIALFKKNYRDPNEHMCIFLIEENVGNFIFIPYDRETNLPNSRPELN